MPPPKQPEMTLPPPHNALHGNTHEQLLVVLVERIGWEAIYATMRGLRLIIGVIKPKGGLLRAGLRVAHRPGGVVIPFTRRVVDLANHFPIGHRTGVSGHREDSESLLLAVVLI